MNASSLNETLHDWQADMADCWQRLPDKGFFLSCSQHG
jgi:hypothetical protein